MNRPPGRLAGRVALVTGAARGSGAAIARALATEGARVVIADVLVEQGNALAEELGDRSLFVHLDVTDQDGWQTAVSTAARELGPVSILVNNAGIITHGPIDKQSLESFRRVLDVNLVGSWLGIQAVTPGLRDAGGGVIVNISSATALIGHAGHAAYTASKWGLRGLTRTAALELAGDRIRVCSVHPGPVHTAMTAGASEDMLRDTTPMARFAEPAEVATMVLFVITAATYSTGCEFVMDGGMTA